MQTSETVPALGGHSGAITKPAVAATSAAAGKTAEITCTRCGTVLQQQTEIPALGYIRNATARQLWPHKKMEVCYEVAEDIGDVIGDGDADTTVPTLTCSYGSTTKTAFHAFGDFSCSPGHHISVWDFEADRIAINQNNVTFQVSVGGTGAALHIANGVAVNTSSSVKNGMNVGGTVELGYSPFADGEAAIFIDGARVLSSTNSGAFLWKPLTTGSHTLKHVSGSYEWTRTVNVTETAATSAALPNPPTAEDANITIATTSKAFAQSGGSGTITTSGSGTWTATASDDWITIPIASRNAGLPVGYKVAANSGVESRTGYIYVSGHVFTITQPGVGAALDSYSADFETDGGAGAFTVLADAQADWTAKADVNWISISPTSGTGESEVAFTVAPWNEVSTRSGTITAAGRTFTVNQTGRRMKIYVADAAATSAALPVVERDYLSHIIDIQVNAFSTTEWDVELDASWLSVVDGGSGHGGDNVAIAINENPSWLPRTGMVRIGTESLTVVQAGRPSAALSFAISPSEATASVDGANALVSVAATPDLPWTATSGANWLTVMPSFQSGAGNGNVVYTASPNSTMAARTGTIRVAAATSAALPAQTHTVSQPAAEAAISAAAHTFDAAGSSFDVEVSVADVVAWSIANSAGWVSVNGASSRIGPGIVTVAAAANPSVESRSATIEIAGHAFSVSQPGRGVEVEYESVVFGTEGGSATLDVHPDGNAQWTAVVSDPAMIVLWGDDGCDYDAAGNVIGTGDHTLEYIVSDYNGDGSPLTATITIGDKVVYVTQRAYDLSIDPCATNVAGNAGSGEVGVPASVGDVWNAIATEPWITIVSGYDSGTGSGTVRFTYTENDTGAVRTGKIVIAGETYTLTQAARQMVAIDVVTDGAGGSVSGGGRYPLGTETTLTAVANDGWTFEGWTLPGGAVATSATFLVVADVDKEIIATFRRIPEYLVNGEAVREGTVKSFAAPAPVVDEVGTTRLVCLGSSAFPDKGTTFDLVVTGDVAFEWDIWQTNHLVTVASANGGKILARRHGDTEAAQQVSSLWMEAGEEVEFTAVPDDGQSFFRWNIAQSQNPVNPVENGTPSASLRLCVDNPLTISAIFGVFDDTIAAAADAPALAFTTGGDAAWLPVVDPTALVGYTSVRSGLIGAESETWLETRLGAASDMARVFSFRWRVDCERDDGGGATWDRLAVFTNGVEAARIDGTTDWRTVELPIDGPAIIRWSFYRDDWDEPGESHENAAWIDGIAVKQEGN